MPSQSEDSRQHAIGQGPSRVAQLVVDDGDGSPSVSFGSGYVADMKMSWSIGDADGECGFAKGGFVDEEACP